MTSWSTTDEFSIMQKLRHLRLGNVVLLALYCLLVAGVAAIRYPPGQWGHAYSKGLLPSLMSVEVSTIVKSDQNYLVKTSSILKQHSTQAVKSPQVQLLSRQEEIAEKESRRGTGASKRRVALRLHEVPSGPNPISNEIPTKLVHAQNSPNSMP